MDVEFSDPKLEALYFDPVAPHPRMSAELVRSYRKVVGLLFGVTNDQELRAFKSLRLEKLGGQRRGQWSLRLHGGSRLMVRFRTDRQGRVVTVIHVIDHDSY